MPHHPCPPIDLGNLDVGCPGLLHLQAPAEALPWLESQISEHCREHDRRLMIAPIPADSRLIRILGRSTRSQSWLSRHGKLAPREAASLIAAIPARVAPRLNANAMNPLRLLCLASLISSAPDVVVFSTSGMDPAGRQSIHRYARAWLGRSCLIHLATTSCGDCRRFGRSYRLEPYHVGFRLL